MNQHRSAATAALLALAAAPALAGFTNADIDFWVGSGQNEAVLVLDWNNTLTPTSLAWGYRFDGPATGEDMLRAVAAADDRLYARIAAFSFGNVLNGIGYDLDNDGFALSDGTAFTNGLATTPVSDTAAATDPDDHYAEGFNSAGFWTYWVAEASPYADTNPEAWEGAAVGFSDRLLTNGSWDGFSFDPAFSFTDPPSEPVAAIPAAPTAAAFALTICAARRRRS